MYGILTTQTQQFLHSASEKNEFFSSHKLLHLRVEITHVTSLVFPR